MTANQRLNHWLTTEREQIVTASNGKMRSLSDGSSVSWNEFVDVERYINLLISMDMEQEPALHAAEVESLCAEYTGHGLSFPALLEVLHIWRDCIIDSMTEAPDHAIERMDILAARHRIDAINLAICKYYWGQTESLIRAMKHKIGELSDERISLIGKMASSMAHEIRNPLTAAGGFIKLIRSQLPCETPASVNHYLGYIEEEFHHINMLITGFLSFSNNRIIEEPCVLIELTDLLDSVLGLYGSRLKNEHICIDLSNLRPMKLYVQKTSILQVFSNILNNSIDVLSAVMDDKTIRFSSAEEKDLIRVTIANNGPEIPDHVKPEIFSPFATGKLDGSGLGLAMCKKIMIKNGGDITFSSTAEETSFTLLFAKGIPAPDSSEEQRKRAGVQQEPDSADPAVIEA